MRSEPASNFIGKKFNMLTVIEDFGCSGGARRVAAICECGNIKEFGWQKIKSGDTKSCGCIIGHNGKGVWAVESIGEVFGRLTVLSLIERKNSKPLAVCICECGQEKAISLQDLRNDKTRSCGCLLSETSRDRMSTHGLSNHPIYKIWKGIKKRCYNKNEKRYKDYGGRGVKMCKEWLRSPKKFIDWALVNGWKKGLVVDKDIKAQQVGVPALLYSPKFCSVVTPAENNKAARSNIRITHNGRTMIATDWAKEIGISVDTIIKRFKNGYPVETVLSKGSVKNKRIQ